MRRFVQLIGIYPAGNLVRLNTGEVAVVLNVYAPDPYRPHVRVLFDREGTAPASCRTSRTCGKPSDDASGARRRSSRRSTRPTTTFDPLLLM